MKREIKNIGSVQPLDKEGYIVNICSLDKVQEQYSPVVEEMLELYQEHFAVHLHSVYLRGSVAKGTAIPPISDIDTIAVSHTKLSKEALQPKRKMMDYLESKYNFLEGAEVHFQSLADIHQDRRLQFLLKTQCVCIFGEDLNPSLPKFKPGKDGRPHSDFFEQDLAKLKNWLTVEKDPKDIRESCNWIMRRMVRIGFELVMEKEQCFTRDLYPCYERFSKHYPEKQEEMYELLKLAVYPVGDAKVIMEKVDSMADFLLKEIVGLG